MALSAMAVAKAAATVLTDKKLRKIVGGILLTVIIIIMAPIAVLLGVVNTGKAIDWSSSEIQQQMMDTINSGNAASLRQFNDTMKALESEVASQALTVDPLKTQIFFYYIEQNIGFPKSDTLYSDFISCFAGGADDDTIFQNIEDRMEIVISAKERLTMRETYENNREK